MKRSRKLPGNGSNPQSGNFTFYFYEALSKEYGLKWSSGDHSNGEFVRKEHLWGRLKTFLRARGGVSVDHLESSVKEVPVAPEPSSRR